MRHSEAARNEAEAVDHAESCTDTDCADGCPVQADRDAEYQSGHEWHE